MTLKKIIIILLEHLTNTHIYRQLPRGVSIISDINQCLPGYHVNIVFDVGANVGQSTDKFLSWFPGAQIYCFEPVSRTFEKLYKNYRAKDNIFCINLALGAFKRKGTMICKNESDLSYLSFNSSELQQYDPTEIENVEIEKLDDFCRAQEIVQISYLKIDTEGHDLEVLKGAEWMLTNNRIELIELEAGMNYRNARHVPFEDLKKFLETRGYFLFSIYEQFPEQPTGEPHLRRVNPVFISENVITVNKKGDLALYG